MTTPITIRFLVQGTPRPAGSKRAFIVNRKGDGKPIAVITDANPASKDWKSTVSFEAKRAISAYSPGMFPLAGPISLKLTFSIARQKSNFGSGRNSSVLRPSAPSHHITRPDVLKLARAVEDALSRVLYMDDAQIVDEHLIKHFTSFTDTTGVIIEAQTLADPLAHPLDAHHSHPPLSLPQPAGPSPTLPPTPSHSHYGHTPKDQSIDDVLNSLRE